MESQLPCSLTVTSRPLMLSHKRRLYLHLPTLAEQYFSSTLRLWFYSPSRRQSLNVFLILLGSEQLFFLFIRLRTFAAKDPLHQHLGYPFFLCHAEYESVLSETLRYFFSPYAILTFFLLSHHAVYPFGLLFGCKALGIQSN